MELPYSHTGRSLSRRRLLALSSAAGAASLFGDLIPAGAVETSADDPRVRTESVTVENGANGLQCYRAFPATNAGQLGSVIIAHDALGLTPHFRDVARRVGIEGFSVLAPDYASRYGGTPSEPMPAREVVGMMKWDEWLADSRAAFNWLVSQPQSNKKVAEVGFGLGGSALGRIALTMSELTSAAVFYGRVPPLENFPQITTRLLLNYASDDPLVDPQVPEFEEALKRAGVAYQLFTYPATKHGFEDDSASSSYSAEAAKLAWSRTIEFLRTTLT